jgi:hypothetical protein
MIYLFPGDFIYWSQVKNHTYIKENLLPIIHSNLGTTNNRQIGNWLCDVNTEFFDLNFTKYLPLITEEIYPVLDKMFIELQNLSGNYKIPKTSTVSSIWYNHYESNSNQEVHSHSNKRSSFSGIYILNLNEENKTVFYSYNASIAGTGTEVKELKEAKEGDIIIFPSSLLHYVLPCERTRDSIAFNISCEY